MANILTFFEMLEDSNTREGALYKWARIQPAGSESDPEVFRFIKVIYGETHRMLVEDGEKPLAGGTVSVADDRFRVMGWGSTTLDVGCDSRHAEDLENTLVAAGRERKR